MTRKRAIVFAVALLATFVLAGTALAAGYWFYQGNLSGTVLTDRDTTGTEYGRQSFDNTNHPGHEQYLVFVLSSGSWDTVGQACPVGQSGCDSGDISVSGLYYPHGGCENPSSYGYAVYTNCHYSMNP